MRLVAPALILLTAVISAPAIAEKPQAQAKEEVQKEEKAREEKKICRRITSMGSRRPERVCMTKKQWRDFNNGN